MPHNSPSYLKRVLDVFAAFFLLGFTSFGGPAAHLGYFNQEFIKLKKWATESQYAQWVALSQIVPGPGSSQVGFALGYHRAGFAGGLAAFVGFTLPSFILMVLLAKFGEAWQGSVLFNGAVHSLKLLAVVVVADACVSMWRSFCQARIMVFVALFSAMFIVFYPFGFASLIVLFMAVCVGVFVPSIMSNTVEALPKVRFAWLFLILAVSLFFIGFFFTDALISLFADFYQAGALVFGGGHVVLPMLSAFVSDTVTESNLLLGYAAAQAVPGPMFTMASFLGASAAPDGENIWVWAGVATLAVFSSGLLIMLSAQNAWQGLSTNVRFRSSVGSLNAAVVGILIAALYHPIGTSSLMSWVDVVMVVIGFTWLKCKRPSIFMLIIAFVLFGLARSYF
ncbi:chromate transporter [Marinomonas ushuaiensis DSM 15871]|uniref:Chromate transporter n=1 Tax=Marinomonas ushuaiensis DSM 15871 TaxID=1122207 RepID=X7E8Z2_9GAMM|nr:chromate efflux transporter [Marinomonas ushuaiensis]ETX12549.1 chromate transporter [Marinomonas ushuaiensis DSM 15871]